jgi:hypothetical protein
MFTAETINAVAGCACGLQKTLTMLADEAINAVARSFVIVGGG